MSTEIIPVITINSVKKTLYVTLDVTSKPSKPSMFLVLQLSKDYRIVLKDAIPHCGHPALKTFKNIVNKFKIAV